MGRPVLRTRLCDILDIEYPVILAGMGGVATAELVAAVSDAGGLGIVGAATMPGDEIERQVRRIRDLTSKPFGVDILLPSGVAPPPSAERSAGGDGEKSAAPRVPADLRQLLPAQYKEFIAGAEREFGLPDRPAAQEEMSQGIRRIGFGPNFAKSQVEAILDLKVPVFASGLGNPEPYFESFH
jgi:NAD(P)H-dependent flavin oxidoreductase YrpB (nitropropane dioxygenase family)